MRSLWVSISVGFLAVLFAGITLAQNREPVLATIMKLPAAERQARLLEGAKKKTGWSGIRARRLKTRWR